MTKEHSNGATASYYELPAGAAQLQDLISHRDMNAQVGEIFRACYRYGLVSHSDKLRDARKILFYAQAEVERLEKLQENSPAAVAPPAEPTQPVNSDRPKLAVGQVWKDREGREVRIVGMDKDDSARPFEGCNGFYYTPYGEIFTEGVEDDGDLIELIQDEHGWRPWKATKDSVCPVGLGVRVFPALAGMNRSIPWQQSACPCVPRARGDEPPPIVSVAPSLQCSPRSRG